MYKKFKYECLENIKKQSSDLDFNSLSREWIYKSFQYKYMYNYEFLGRPIIQYPQDILAIQEIIWSTKPDLIIETGIAHGGSLILSASMLALLDIKDSTDSRILFNPENSPRKVLGIDTDIRTHNRIAIEGHFLASRIQMLEGSSIAPDIIKEVQQVALNHKRILILLDSNHTHEHVLAELEAYAPLVSEGSYCVIFDTIIEELPADIFPDRPWGPGNNPKTAVWAFLKKHPEFEIDKTIENKLLITVGPGGYLKRLPSK